VCYNYEKNGKKEEDNDKKNKLDKSYKKKITKKMPYGQAHIG
jgi:hypothetical protein